MRPLAAAVAAAAVLAATAMAATSLGATRDHATAICRRDHGHRVCHRVRPHHPQPGAAAGTPSTDTTPSPAAPAPDPPPPPAAPAAPASSSTSSTTTMQGASAPPPLPHGTEVDAKATGLQSPFYALTANETTLAAGTVRFNVYNVDQDPHTLAVADAAGNQIGQTVDLPAGHPGSAVQLIVTLPPGTYQLFCTLPGHAAAGMRTTIVVR